MLKIYLKQNISSWSSNKKDRIKHLRDYKAFNEYSNDIDDIKEYNQNKRRKTLIVFDDMIADVLSNEKLNPIALELFIRGIKLKTSLVFITQFYFDVLRNLAGEEIF